MSRPSAAGMSGSGIPSYTTADALGAVESPVSRPSAAEMSGSGIPSYTRADARGAVDSPVSRPSSAVVWSANERTAAAESGWGLV